LIDHVSKDVEMHSIRQPVMLALGLILCPGAAVCLADSPAPSSNRDPVVVLTVSSREIEVGDPLLVRVTFINGTADSIPLYTRYTARTGLVQFHQKVDGEWQFVRAYGQGALSLRNSASELPPTESRATIESLFWVGEEAIFTEPGERVIRAGVRCPPVEYWSEPISIRVKPATPEKRAFLQVYGRDLHERLAGSPASNPFEFPMADLERLPESQLRRQLLWDAAFYRWAGATNGDVDRPEWRELQELLPKLDKVNHDRFQIAIATIHHKHRRYDEMIKALDTLPDPTPTAIWLRGEAERAKAAPAP
jgi:hypothetical protein